MVLCAVVSGAVYAEVYSTVSKTKNSMRLFVCKMLLDWEVIASRKHC